MKKELLLKYFAGKTSEEEEKQIMDWVEASSENYQLYLQERKYWNALLVNSNLKKISLQEKPKRTVNLWMFSTAAAAIALLFVLMQWLRPVSIPDEKWQTIWVPAGQRAQITLDDGTTVWLNSRSRLSFPTSFVANKRVVKLNGEGFFEVQKDSEHPFIVETNKYNIEVLGTSFNVLAYQDHEIFETSLINGLVQVSPLQHNMQSITLNPRERVIESSGKLQVTQIDNYEHFRWREGLICLDDERFENLINKFSLYFDIRIQIENPKLLDYRCTGKFRQNDGIDYALKVLQSEMKFTYTRNNELNEIVIR
ncbi:MAG: FecR domain-containing protein [Tannerella sp.]|jgi:ferric-dicitrate binding protein FerR (iron transport regulator)|nr:FecR domain-containing protein [Tannerella sp.]